MKREPPTKQMRVKTNTAPLVHGTRSGHHWTEYKAWRREQHELH